MRNKQEVIVRLAAPEFDHLAALVFSRYPDYEWATFARFGWRESSRGLVLTLASLDPPTTGELDESVGHVRILEPYSLRIALQAETHTLGVGIIHSHPLNCAPHPSSIDDDMDGYYASYFSDFAKQRPYISLILSRSEARQPAISGRVFWRNSWLRVDRFAVERTPVESWIGERRRIIDEDILSERVARLRAAFGEEAFIRLRRATVAVIGAGGTGSMAIELLARAGVGRIIIVDPDHLSESNLERVHGSRPEQAKKQVSKAEIARQHILSINPYCEVEAYIGALPQKEIIDAVVRADVALGCTDQQHSRLSLSDICFRYLVPSLDCGVSLEGSDGEITGQIIQVVRFLAADPCALCRDMVQPLRIAEELMSEDEKGKRQAEAEEARKRGEDPGPYWMGLAQLNTVGYLTGIAGAMVAGYAIGWLTGRFDPPFLRTQMNLVAEFFDVNDIPQAARDFCACRRIRGWADQGQEDALISAPSHWPTVKLLTDEMHPNEPVF